MLITMYLKWIPLRRVEMGIHESMESHYLVQLIIWTSMVAELALGSALFLLDISLMCTMWTLNWKHHFLNYCTSTITNLKHAIWCCVFGHILSIIFVLEGLPNMGRRILPLQWLLLKMNIGDENTINMSST